MINQDWIKITDELPPIGSVVECAARSGCDESLYRTFAGRRDCGDSWSWAECELYSLNELGYVDDVDVVYWRYPTLLPEE